MYIGHPRKLVLSSWKYYFFNKMILVFTQNTSLVNAELRIFVNMYNYYYDMILNKENYENDTFHTLSLPQAWFVYIRK